LEYVKVFYYLDDAVKLITIGFSEEMIRFIFKLKSREELRH